MLQFPFPPLASEVGRSWNETSLLWMIVNSHSQHAPVYPSLLKADLMKILRYVVQGRLKQEAEQRLKPRAHQPVNTVFPLPDLFAPVPVQARLGQCLGNRNSRTI